MKITINFTKKQIDSILKKNGYETSEVLLWYKLSDYEDSKLGCYKERLAYPRGMDCKWNSEERPMLSDYEDFIYDKVAQNLINDLFFQMVLDN